MPVVCLNWETAHLHGETWISHHRLRHRLFVERQQWEVPAFQGLEFDQFDTPAAQYLVWIDGRGETRGVARLLPTTRPYMLKTLWPDLASGELPESDAVWEVTRFGCDQDLEPRVRRRAVAEILCAMQEFGLQRGMDGYLVVTPRRLLKSVVVNAGCAVTILGPERILGRRPALAAFIHIDRETLEKLRRRAGIAGSVLRPEMSVAA